MTSNHRPTLLIATDGSGFNTNQWEQEGYTVIHLPAVKSRRDIEDTTDSIETDDRCVILGKPKYRESYFYFKKLKENIRLTMWTNFLLAYGKAATHALTFAISGERSLVATIAYYPPSLPALSFHPTVNILVHLPASSHFSLPETDNVKVCVYEDVKPGFAETSSEQYDRIAAGLAFSRSLGLLRRTIGPVVDVEAVRDAQWKCDLEGDVQGALDQMVSHPHVNAVPSCAGGTGYSELLRFYRDCFISSSPKSLRFKLISRTVGINRVVDEMVASFRHTTEIPWMLPGVAPTGRECEIAIVFVVAMRGAKIATEHVYWDQATVLLQLGLVNGESLPISGVESARRLLDRAVESRSVER